MGVDLKDITDLIPFIIENLSKCIYIIVICLIAGFIIGSLVQKIKMNLKVHELVIKLAKKEEEVEILNERKKEVEKKFDECSEKCNNLQNQITLVHNDTNANSNYSTLNDLERIINSSEGRMEITALIELSLKRENETTGRTILPE